MDDVGEKEYGNYGWGGAWVFSWFLLVIGTLGALLAIALALMGAMADDVMAANRIAAALPIAFSAIALIGGGAALRWCCSCGDWCDWDDEGQGHEHPHEHAAP